LASGSTSQKGVNNKLIAIVGPTAVGKTAVSLYLAKLIDAEIISADSMQVYKGMDIGTAKPSLGERETIPHHLIDIIEPEKPFSVAEYQKLARSKIREIQKRGRFPLLVGGSGLYIRAVIDKLDFPSGNISSEIRQKLEERAAKVGSKKLFQELIKIDPEAAQFIHPNNLRRIIRALEVYYLTGRQFSYFHKQWKVKKSIYNLKMFGLAMERSKLYANINSRVNKQIEQGLLEEVKRLVKKGYKHFLTSRQALGYKELVEHLEGKASLEEAINLVKRRTRKYARRQLIWFRADPRIHWIDVTNLSVEEVVQKVKTELEKEHFI
jgi:tRNA dimethylallyltransferase